MRSIPASFYKSNAWKRCRDAYFSSVGGLCERCKAKGLIVPGYIVHHKTHLTPENYEDPSISLNFDNLEVLCKQCHNEEHFKKLTGRRWTYVNGELVVIGERETR